jgi:pimeloyl-ACP methyl ester carboxylesterase
VVVGNSFGGLVALHLALSEPERVSALVLADSAGLGQGVNPAIVGLTLPEGGELVAAWERTPPGAAQRAFRRSLLMFAPPWQIPPKWLTGQYKVAQVPNFTETTPRSLRTAIGLSGQREVLVDQLPGSQMPTLIVWGIEDRVLPYWQATAAVTHLKKGTLKLIANCGTCPTSRNPSGSYRSSASFLGSSTLTKEADRHSRL